MPTTPKSGDTRCSTNSAITYWSTPVTKPDQNEWTTYLPAENWIDVWTGETVPGAQAHTRSVPIDVIPVYCRAGGWSKMQEVFAPPR